MYTWVITAEVNLDASHWENVTVKANTERKARIFAIEKLKKMGFNNPRIIFIYKE